MDKLAPSSAISFPANNGAYQPANVGQSGSRFQAAVTDTGYAANNAGVSSSQMRLSYIGSDNATYYWTGVAFSSSVTPSSAYLGTVGPSPYTYLTDISWLPALDGSGHRQFKIEWRGEDAATLEDGTGGGNVEVPGDAGVDTRSFIIDNSPPDVAITTPVASALNSLSLVTGTADATLSGLNRVEVRISTGSGAFYWTGSSWTAASTWLTSTKDSETAWHYTVPGGMLVDDRVYRTEARAVDQAGNISATYSTATFTYDTTAPSITLSTPTARPYSGVVVSTPFAGTTSNPQTSANTGVTTEVEISVTEDPLGTPGVL